MKLYTRTGDDGTTGLFGGDRVDKSHPRVEAYGTVDELNASLGVAITGCGDDAFQRQLADRLTAIQSRLFDLGADLATPPDSPHAGKIARLDHQHVIELERLIDDVESGNTPMSSFVLPGGTELSARLHLARAVCRRAERLLIPLSREHAINTEGLIYLNRLSDLLFAMARRANREAGVADVPWTPGQPPA